MSFGSLLRRNFSPYEIAVMGWVLGHAFAIIGFGMFGTGRTGIGLILMISTPILLLTFAELSRCPGCGKVPFQCCREHAPTPLFYRLFFNYRLRLWPERECSECRYPLDEEPPLQ